MFTPFDLIEYVVVVVALVFSAAFYVFVLRRRRVEDYRCPGCNFLVDIKDVKQYGYVCPDCRTDWRVHPLKNDEDEETEICAGEAEESGEPQSSGGQNKRLVR